MELVIPSIENSSFYDNTRLEAFRTCHRKYYLRHVRHWAPLSTSIHLVFGLSWHAAMDTVWQMLTQPIVSKMKAADMEVVELAMTAFMDVWNSYYPPEEETVLLDVPTIDTYPKTPGRAKDMLMHYVPKRRPMLAEYELLGIETPFIVPIAEEDINIYYIGRNDKLYRHTSRVYAVDHKTTKSAKSRWLESFSPNNQMDGYHYACVMTYGEEFDHVYIDGALVQKGSAKDVYEQGMPPGIGFPYLPLKRVPSAIESWLWETTYTIRLLESHVEMLQDCKPSDGILKSFDKVTTSCPMYFGCIYRDICNFIDNPMREALPPAGFKEEEWIPFKILDVAAGVSKEALGEGDV